MAEKYAVFSLNAGGKEVPPPFPADMDTSMSRAKVQELFTLAMLEGARPCRYDGPSDVYRIGALVLRPYQPPSVFFPKVVEVRPPDALAPQEF